MYTRTPFLLIFRLVLALVTTTFFQPDEFFQSLEVAHHAVFGYGYLTWEWTTEHPVRSPLYLSLYAGVYWILKALHLDGTGLLVCTCSSCLSLQ
jgi:phosphatidylinositol glycan class B